MEKEDKKRLTRREFVKTAGIGALAAGIGPPIFLPGPSQAAGKELKILVWSHFVPQFDKEWYDNFARNWGKANGVAVTVDHIGLAELPSRTAAEVSIDPGCYRKSLWTKAGKPNGPETREDLLLSRPPIK